MARGNNRRVVVDFTLVTAETWLSSLPNEIERGAARPPGRSVGELRLLDAASFLRFQRRREIFHALRRRLIKKEARNIRP